jgi:hypothetical protein
MLDHNAPADAKVKVRPLSSLYGPVASAEAADVREEEARSGGFLVKWPMIR